MTSTGGKLILTEVASAELLDELGLDHPETTAPKGVVKVVSEMSVIKWENGLPVPTSVPIIQMEGIKTLGRVALSLPYKGTPDPGTGDMVIESGYEGMTNAEVMMIKLARSAAEGKLDATKEILDRSIGKPNQSVTSKTLKLSYQDFLDEMERTGETPEEQGGG